ncbi:hypothetical protein Taro_019626 [Colocasia esculenta]|uniref:Uncharacterized protein n=1 Tax=Colocasia esculenta TaxID=4460 RepID=A0A843V630_COLES|nr:hypothetical protein [Colocasia esculenta]
MDGRLCFGVLAAFLLISVAVGVRDAAALVGHRVLRAKKDGERSEPGQVGDHGNFERSALVQGATTPPAEGNSPIPSSVPKDSAPPVTPSNSKPAADAPPNPPAVPQKDLPVSGSPSRPPPAPLNPPPSSSGSPLNKSPPSGDPPLKSPASKDRSNPSPVSGKHPAPPESKLPNPAPSGHERERPTSGEDGKDKEKKQQPGTSPNPEGSQGKGQATEWCNVPHRCHINIQVDAVEGQDIVLQTGNENCTLHMTQQSSAGSFFQQFPNYANHVTPIHGVYLASLTVIFIGGTWACCRFRKRRRVDAGVAYQQLEMGTQQQSSNALDDEGAMTNGWDNGWNDDWDEEEAAPRPPEKRESASQNGAAIKSSDKNEWEDWDD